MRDPNDLVVLRRVPDELTGLLLVGELESRGIAATTIGGLTAQLRAEAPGLVSVLVRRSDVARAEAALSEEEGASADDALKDDSCEDESWEDEAEAAPREDDE